MLVLFPCQLDEVRLGKFEVLRLLLLIRLHPCQFYHHCFWRVADFCVVVLGVNICVLWF